MNPQLMNKLYRDFLVARKGKTIEDADKNTTEALIAEKLLQTGGNTVLSPDGGGKKPTGPAFNDIEPGFNDYFR